MNWTLFAAFVVAQVLAGWAFYRLGQSRPRAIRRAAPDQAIPHPERTDGKLLRATPAEIDAYFGPRPVSR